jgi:hypothetical protein
MKLAVGGDCYPFVRDGLSYSFNLNSECNSECQKAKDFAKLGEKGVVFILAAVVLGL